MTNYRALIPAFLVCLCAFNGHSFAAEPAQLDLDARFNNTVRPFLQSYCVTCHSGEKPKGQLDLSTFSSMETVMKSHQQWDTVLEQLRGGDMPPESAKAKPTIEQRKAIIDWITSAKQFESKKNAGDPGLVLARRLSNAEYDYTIRDLTGVDIRPTHEFPVDPANEAGFDNSGESLSISPSLVKKYLEAASTVADHLVLNPDGFTFGPYPMIVETDRDKYAVNRVVDFYKEQPIELADYFQSVWRFKNRAALGKPNATLGDMASQSKISLKYLQKVWGLLSGPTEDTGPIAALQIQLSKLPAPAGQAEPETLRAGCEKMRDFIVDLRPWVTPQIDNFPTRGVPAGSQSLVLWKDRKMAESHLAYSGNALSVDMSGYTNTHPVMLIPANEDARKRYEDSFKRFCAVFPDTFVVVERGRVFSNNQGVREADGRLLSAGFHSQMGYFRDDQPLYDLILDEKQQRELDERWREFDFITNAPVRQHEQFLWFERAEPPGLMLAAEFNSFRPEDASIASEAKIKELAELYIARARTAGATEEALEVVADHFKRVNTNIRAVEQGRLAAEPSHLAAVLDFASRAYRRPLSQAEKDEILEFYRDMRKEKSDHEVAMRDTVMSVLMSPELLYRINTSEASGEARPISGYALASRLSYFLWSSMPDKELLAHAAAGDLNKPEVIAAQAKRMLQDHRIAALATEFGGNWLDIRRFEEHNAVDRERFPSFTNDLREAMFQEPIHFFVDVVKHNASLLDFLYGDYTIVNPILAKHYGMPEIKGDADSWVRVEGASKYERGGLLPMSVFLTKNAPGLRTSPVKRGYWVVHRLLGEQIPAPPPNVPVIPSDETKLGDLTLRQTMEKHREDKTCATCHSRFDSFGLVFEGYGPIGEAQTRDLGNRPVETTAPFPDGTEATGLKGLREYIRGHREENFVDNFCQKMLVFALGRSLMPSDDLLIADMRAKLKADGNRFGNVVESIVTSPQFLNMRANPQVAKE